METIIVKPQEGFQEEFLSCNADIAIGGGAAGVGKTYAELLEPLNHREVKGFNAIFFRRTTVQIRNPGALWDTSATLYPLFKASPNSQQLDWTFESGVTLKFSHLEHEKNIYDHQGAQYCLIIWDELTHFTKKMFIYLLSRNRSMCGVKPYMRATCNPDPDSFVAELIAWWIDQDMKLPNGDINPRYGLPIPERAGKLRYIFFDQDKYIWGDTKEEVLKQIPHLLNTDVFKKSNPLDLIKSITFIPGSIYENQKLLEKDPSYLANLLAQDPDEQSRLLHGNWKIKVDELCIFHAISVLNMFTNIYPSNTLKRYITVDAARFGDDLCTIFVWYGWKVVKLIVISKSDSQETVDTIERERKRFEIVKGHVIIDQSGLGSGVVRLGHYLGFMGGNPPLEEPGTFIKEFYKNLKTQCFYRYAARVNNDEVSLPLSNENVVIDGIYSTKIKIKGVIYDVRDLIMQDHKAIKRKDKDGEGKIQINSKEEQKILLDGRSPDFADGLSLRAYFELTSGDLTIATAQKPNGVSILDRII